MATNTSFHLAEEELSCPICFEEFSVDDSQRNPKLLLCLHTFCLSCIKNLLKYDGKIQCSICRTVHQVNHITELMDNYLVHDHLR